MLIKLFLYSCVKYILISGNTAQSVQTWSPINYHNNYHNPLSVSGGPKNSFLPSFIQKSLPPNYSDINTPFEELQTYVWDKLIAATIASAIASRYNPNLNIYDQNKLDVLEKSTNAIKTIPNVVNNYIIIPSDLLGNNKTAIGNINTITSGRNEHEILRRNELGYDTSLRPKLIQNCEKLRATSDDISKKEKIEKVCKEIKNFESSRNQKHQVKSTLEHDMILDNKEKHSPKKQVYNCNKKKRQHCTKKCQEDTEKKQKRRKKKSKKLDKSCKPIESECCQCGKHKKQSRSDKKKIIPKSEFKQTEKVTNFDQKCVDDILNINLEYSDHDCECIRNSRNNGNSKNSLYSIPSDDFSNYMSFVNDVISKQQFGSFSFDPEQIYPYNFEKFFQMPLYSNVVPIEINSNQNDINEHSNRKSNKKESNKKSSDKKPKKQNKFKKVDLPSAIVDVEMITDPNPSSIETIEKLEEYDTTHIGVEVFDILDNENLVPVKINDDTDYKNLKSTLFSLYETPETNAAYQLAESLLEDDDDDYYPDFTTANGAYITSSEEEEWNNFHNRNFYSGDREAKREININGLFKNSMNNVVNSPPTHSKLINKQSAPITKQQKNNRKNHKDKISFGTPPSLESPDFRSRKLKNTEIPHYIKFIYTDEMVESHQSNDNKNYVETVYAPSKVINYSLPPDDAIYFFGTEDSSERNLCVKEGDTTIVISKSLDH